MFQRLNSSDPGTAAKIIFLTGDMANEGTRLFLGSLTNVVLEKPISIQDLEEAINTVAEMD